MGSGDSGDEGGAGGEGDPGGEGAPGGEGGAGLALITPRRASDLRRRGRLCGRASGGEASGGKASGGEASGGRASGGEASGGNAGGGEASGGEASGWGIFDLRGEGGKPLRREDFHTDTPGVGMCVASVEENFCRVSVKRDSVM